LTTAFMGSGTHVGQPAGGRYRPRSVRADTVVGVGAALLVGWGGVVLLPALLIGRIDLLVGAVAAFGAGLFVALVAGWIDDLALIVVALPLPAILSTGTTRLSAGVLATALVVAAWVLRRPTAGRPLELGRLPRGAGAAILGVSAVAGLFAADVGAAVREMVNLGLLALFLVAATDALADSKLRAHRLAVLVGTVAAATGVAAALESLGVFPGEFPLTETSLFRAGGGFGQPNGLGMFLALGLPFATYVRRTASTPLGRGVGVVFITVVAAGLLATFSRGSWLAVVVAPSVFLLLGRWRAVLRAWGTTLLLVVLADVLSGGAIRDRIAAALVDPSALQRLALMSAGGLMFLDRPLTGVGPGGFGEALDVYGSQVAGLWDFVPSAHNAYIHMAAETGVGGLVALVAFLGAAGLRLLRRAREAGHGPGAELQETLLWAFSTAVVLGMFEWFAVHGIVQVVLLVMAMGLAGGGVGSTDTVRQQGPGETGR
jgi:putative inorganic carbon (HCO3(-)) transporter